MSARNAPDVTLAEFIEARYAEREAAAKAGGRRAGMPWLVDPEPGAAAPGS